MITITDANGQTVFIRELTALQLAAMPAAIERLLLSPAQYAAAQQAAAEARMTPEQKAERDRVQKLTDIERQAEWVHRNKIRVDLELAKPDIAAAVGKLVDGKASVVEAAEVK